MMRVSKPGFLLIGLSLKMFLWKKWVSEIKYLIKKIKPPSPEGGLKELFFGREDGNCPCFKRNFSGKGL